MTEKISKELDKLGYQLYRECRKKQPDIERVKSLLTQGGDPNRNGEETLENLVKSSHLVILKAMLDAGAVFSVKTLITAIRERKAEVVCFLLERGVPNLGQLYKPYNGSHEGPVYNWVERTARESSPEIQQMVAEAVQKLDTVNPTDPTIVELQRQITEMAAEITTLRKKVEELENPIYIKLSKSIPPKGMRREA